MTAKQTRRLLIVAFALSLILHLIAAVFVHLPLPTKEDQTQIVRVMRIRTIRIARVVPTPPPSPTPPPPTAAPTHAPKANPHRAISANGMRPVGTSVVPTHAPPAITATPHVAPTPDCSKTDTPVTVAQSPAPPDIPPLARTSTTGGTARIDVTVDATGNVASTAIAQTSGDAQLDQIALSMAREARYAPATHACKPIASQYAYTVRFVPW